MTKCCLCSNPSSLPRSISAWLVALLALPSPPCAASATAPRVASFSGADMLRIVTFLLCWACAFAAHAGYAQLAPPPAFQSVGGVSTIPVGAAANGARYAGGHVIANASLNLGARAVTVPVGFRVAANAATFAVTKMNPWIAGLSLAASAIPYIVDWFAGEELEITPLGKIQVPAKPGESIPAGPDDYWVSDGGQVVRISSIPKPPNCDAVAGYPQCTTGQAQGRQTACFNGVRSGCFVSAPDPVTEGSPARPATESDLAPLANKPIDPRALVELGVPLPVDPNPIINPATEPVGDVVIGPNGNPAPQLEPSPIRFPDGDPVPIPNTSPQRYTQPWHEVVPSPTPSEPWRVDVRPVVTETTDPTPQPDPTPNPNPNPNPIPNFYTDCDKYPGSLGCMPVGTPPTDGTIPTQTRTITQQQGPSFGGGGTCPANLMVTVHGQSIKALDMAQPCSWIVNYVKPVLLLLAAISAVFIVAPRSEG